MAVGLYLKELRQAKGISQKELSELTGREVSNAEISRLEAGIRKKPSPAILKTLAPHLGVPVGLLLARAGYMDEGTAETLEGDAGTDNRYMERLLVLEEEANALKKANQDMQAEADSLRTRNAQLEATNKDLEEKCDYMLLQGTPSRLSDRELEEENAALRERNTKLMSENKRIMDETVAFLEEGATLREEADSLKRRAATAEETARRARISLEDTQRELQDLKDKGVMFVHESDEEQEKEFAKIKDELLGVINQKNDLLDEKDSLVARVRELEAGSGDGGGGGSAEQQADLQRLEAELEQMTKEKSALEQDIAEVGERLRETEASRKSLEKDLDDFMENMEKIEKTQIELAMDKTNLEKELRAEKEAARANAPLFAALSSVKVDGKDLGRLFMATANDAAQEDLDMLAVLMNAMSDRSLKSSDRGSIAFILKNYMKTA